MESLESLNGGMAEWLEPLGPGGPAGLSRSSQAALCRNDPSDAAPAPLHHGDGDLPQNQASCISRVKASRRATTPSQAWIFGNS